MRNLPDVRREMDRAFPTFLTSDFDRMSSWRPLLRQLDDIFLDFSSNFPSTNDFRGALPAVGLEEKAECYLLNLDMPGLEKDEIDIDIRGNQIMVTGEHKTESKSQEESEFVTESSFRKYSRTLTLPIDAKDSEVEAEYRNGVLSIVIPKAEGSKHQKIKVGEKKSGLLSKFLGEASPKGKQSIEAKAHNKTAGH